MSDCEATAKITIDLNDGNQSESEEMASADRKPLTASNLLSPVECTAVAAVTGNKSGEKRRRRTRAGEIWSHSRKHVPGLGPEWCEVGRRLWCCKACPSYSVSSTSGARGHMASVHSYLTSSLGREETANVTEAVKVEMRNNVADIKGQGSER